MAGLLTVGHGTAAPDDLVALLRGAGVELVVDVRRFPGSRRDPAMGREAIGDWLPAAGVAYHWEPRLGGRRRVPAGQDDSVDGWWRVPAFRAYAAHMRTDEFRAGLDDVLLRADHAATAIMCSESLWWRCHRRLVGDAVTLLHDRLVRHLWHDGHLTDHEPPEAARTVGRDLYYEPAPTD